jgi:ribose 5-phosphate isomerase B
MNLYIGADHNGFTYKQAIVAFLVRSGHTVINSGDSNANPDDDFPQFAAQVVHAMQADSDTEAKGILICGSGQGMCMAANRFKGIRASLCWNEQEARAARNDDDSNVLCLSARYLSEPDTESIITTWLATSFAAAPRFIRRIQQLDTLQ